MCLNGNNPEVGVRALRYSMKDIEFKRSILFSYQEPTNLVEGIEFIKTRKLTHAGSCWFMLHEINKYIDTDFCLSVHDDGFVINPHLWTDEFHQYDYIGAPWNEFHQHRVGNGGFTLRSKKFMELCQSVPYNGEHDDILTCITYHDYFVANGCRFAPLELAMKFSLESFIPECKYDLNNCFGFHGRGEVEYLFRDEGQQFKDRIALLDEFK